MFNAAFNPAPKGTTMTDKQPAPTTTDAGIPIESDEHSLTIGPDGPILLHDHYLMHCVYVDQQLRELPLRVLIRKVANFRELEGVVKAKVLASESADTKNKTNPKPDPRSWFAARTFSGTNSGGRFPCMRSPRA